MASESRTVDPVIDAIQAGHAAILVVGNLNDLAVRVAGMVYWPEFLADELSREYVVVRYSKSGGARVHGYAGLAPNEREPLDRRLNAIGLRALLRHDGPHNADEVRTFFRALGRLLQLPGGREKPVAALIEYCEHLSPQVQSSAAAADEHTYVTEMLHRLANAPALQKSRNVLVCLAARESHHSLLNDFHAVRLAFPSEREVGEFLRLRFSPEKEANASRSCTPADGLDENELARITRGLRLRDIESMLREARVRRVPLSRSRVLKAKADAIERVSEGTLSVMRTDLTLDDLEGMAVVKHTVALMADKLKNGDPSSPRAVLLAGPPGTAKSTLAPIMASLAGFNIVKFAAVKNMWYGESERRLRLALSLVEGLAPCILFCDEITESIPSRTAQAADGGASLELLAQLFQFSARDDLRGRVLLLAATNLPERLDPAWQDRFVNVPVLELGPQEMVRLFAAFERRVKGSSHLESQDPKLAEAARILHRKGVSPRKVLDVVNHALLYAEGELDPEDILRAANDYVATANPMATAYSSLTAIALASFRSFLPWSLDPERYVYPWYLEGVVDRATGELHPGELQKRLGEYRAQAHV